MKDIKEYIDQKVAILCRTEELAEAINEIIEKQGGRKLSQNYNSYKENFCFNLEDITKSLNKYGNLDYYLKYNYKIIDAEDILLNNYINFDYEIF